MNELDRIRQLAGVPLSKKLNESFEAELDNTEAQDANQADVDEGIELGDENEGQEAYYIVDTQTKAIKAGPFQSSGQAMQAAQSFSAFNPAQHSIDIGVDDNGTLINNAPFEESGTGLENGYNDIIDSYGEDFFPNGADGSVVTATGPSGSRQGDNPEQKYIQVAEVHKELVYGYRSFLREGQKEHEENRDAAQRELDRREAEGEDMSGHHVDPKTYKIVKAKKK